MSDQPPPEKQPPPPVILLEPRRTGDMRHLARILALMIWEQAKKDAAAREAE